MSPRNSSGKRSMHTKVKPSQCVSGILLSVWREKNMVRMSLKVIPVHPSPLVDCGRRSGREVQDPFLHYTP
jgi:hypothetical protein